MFQLGFISKCLHGVDNSDKSDIHFQGIKLNVYLFDTYLSIQLKIET